MPSDNIDVEFISHGSIISIRPLTPKAHDWIDENVALEGRIWLGGALCADPRCAFTICQAMTEDGLICA